EGVDRNSESGLFEVSVTPSPSPRRAWIEIIMDLISGASTGVALPTEGVDRNIPPHLFKCLVLVALPTEGVDRNLHQVIVSVDGNASPSPRRAWIEIKTVYGSR